MTGTNDKHIGVVSSQPPRYKIYLILGYNVAACYDGGFGTFYLGKRLTQKPGGQHTVVAERTGRVDGNNIKPAPDAAVLEPVIKNKNPVGKSVCGLKCALIAVAVDNNAGFGAIISDQSRLIGLIAGSFIAAAQNRGRYPSGRKMVAKPYHKRGFTGAAGGYVANTDNWKRRAHYRKPAAVVSGVSGLNDNAVDKRNASQQQ